MLDAQIICAVFINIRSSPNKMTILMIMVLD
jgi:hypothetical protein